VKPNYICILFTLCLAFSACLDRKEDAPIDLSAGETVVLGERWALIVEPYAAYRIRPSFSASVSAHGREGDIVKVSGTFIDTSIPKPPAASSKPEKTNTPSTHSNGTSSVLWYQFSSGWLPEKTVRIYSNKLKAEFAAENMQK